MAYVKQTWVNGQSPLNAERMNHIEEGIRKVSDGFDRYSATSGSVDVSAHEPTEEHVKLWINQKENAVYVKNPETGDYELIVGFQGESAYDAAIRLGKTNLSEEEWVAEYVEKRNEAIEAIDNKGKAVLQTLPDDYIKMSLEKASAIFTDASGYTVHITDGAEGMPVKSLTIKMEPLQISGDGNPPSPHNGYEFYGLKRLDINVTGNNIFDKQKDRLDIYLPAGTTIYAKQIGAVSSDPNAGLVMYGTNAINGYPIRIPLLSNEMWGMTIPVPIIGLMFEPGVLGTFGDDLQLMIALEKFDEMTPYSGQSFTIDLEEPVYGGTVNLDKGVIMVDTLKIAYDGTEDGWEQSDMASNTMRITPPANFAAIVGCTHYINRSVSVSDNDMSVSSEQYINFRDSENAVDVDTWKAYLAKRNTNGRPVTVLYKLDEPYSIPIPSLQYKTQKGANYIWCNVLFEEQTFTSFNNELVEVTYAADTKLYADGKDSTAMIGTAEPGMIATKNYASGDFVVVGKSLYKATAAIATGEAIIPGMNCTATTVVEQLAAIYNLLNA